MDGGQEERGVAAWVCLGISALAPAGERNGDLRGQVEMSL